MKSIYPVITLAVICAGCSAPPTFPSYSPAAYASRARTHENSGLKISVDPFFDEARQKEYFGIEAASSGILPVYLQAQNVSPNACYVVRRQSFRLNLSQDSSASADQAVSHRSKTGEAVGDVGGTLVSLPLIFVAGSMMAHATSIQQNLASKEFKDQTLSASQQAEGFMYFHVEKQQLPLLKEGVLSVTVLNTYTQQTNQFNIPLQP